MIPEEWDAVFRYLVEGTKAGVLDWEQQEGSATLRVSLSGSTIVLVRQRQGRLFSEISGRGPREGVSIRLLDGGGDVVDSFEVFEDEDQGQRVKELYNSARRKALRIDEVLRDAAEELRRLQA